MEITLRQYQGALLRLSLIGRPPSDATLADPGFQRSHTLRTIRLVLMRREAERRGIQVDRAAAMASLAHNPDLEQWAGSSPTELEAAAAKRGVEADDLWRILEEDALAEALRQQLLAEIDDEALWERYRVEQTKLRLTVVRILNVPSSKEISQYVKHHPADIEAYYRANRPRYEQPARANIRIFLVAVPQGAGEEVVLESKARAEAFRRQALTADFEALARKDSDDERTARDGGAMTVTKTRMPLAFETPVGEVSEVRRHARGFYFLKVESLEASRVRALDPALRREIASALIQQAGIAPSIAEVAATAREALANRQPDAVEAAITGQVAETISTDLVSIGTNGRIPGLGQLPGVRDAALALEQPGDVSEAILDGNHVYVIRLEERVDADRLQFHAQKDSYRKSVLQAESRRILERTIEARMLGKISFDLRALQKVYGVKRRDGSVQKVD